MPKEIITSSSSPTTGFTDKSTPSPLAQAIRWNDNLFVSGQGPLDPETKEVVSTDIQEQTRQTLGNLARVLEAAGPASPTLSICGCAFATPPIFPNSTKPSPNSWTAKK